MPQALRTAVQTAYPAAVLSPFGSVSLKTDYGAPLWTTTTAPSRQIDSCRCGVPHLDATRKPKKPQKLPRKPKGKKVRRG